VSLATYLWNDYRFGRSLGLPALGLPGNLWLFSLWSILTMAALRAHKGERIQRWLLVIPVLGFFTLFETLITLTIWSISGFAP
jgi:hypothetical protein